MRSLTSICRAGAEDARAVRDPLMRAAACSIGAFEWASILLGAIAAVAGLASALVNCRSMPGCGCTPWCSRGGNPWGCPSGSHPRDVDGAPTGAPYDVRGRRPYEASPISRRIAAVCSPSRGEGCAAAIASPSSMRAHARNGAAGGSGARRVDAHAPVGHLRIGEDLVEHLNRAGWNLHGLELRQQVGAGEPRGERNEPRDQRRPVVRSRRPFPLRLSDCTADDSLFWACMFLFCSLHCAR